MSHTIAAHAKLLVKLQGQGSRTIDLTGDSFTIGRKAGNDLTIDEQAVSGQHARLTRVQSVYFLEDLKSTNGTSVNGQHIERQQLRDADVIMIGRHRIVFQEPSSSSAPDRSPSGDLDQTMVIGQKETPHSSHVVLARILVTQGKTDKLEYRLTQPVTLIGGQQGAAIRLTGWFAPKSVAQIFQRGGSYFVSSSQNTKQLLVNGQDMEGQHQLKNGDQIQVAGVTLIFYVTTSEK